MSYSPWGKIQNVERYDRGFSSVGTSGHGGYRCSPGWAEANLSEAARKRAIRSHGALWFEEDVDWAIVAWEVPGYWPLMFRHATGEIKDNPQAYLLRTLSSWSCDYLIERGITPDPKGKAYWDEWHEDARRRQVKDPDLITSAITHAPEVVKVTTADDKEHYVTTESYRARGGLNLLSKCEVILGVA